jgi:hypothetical protein
MDREEFIRKSEALGRRQEELGGRRTRVDHMQPGEDPEHAAPEDAGHWAAVYRELTEFKREMLAGVEGMMKAAGDPAVEDELFHDREILRSELERLELHEAFWSESFRPTT